MEKIEKNKLIFSKLNKDELIYLSKVLGLSKIPNRKEEIVVIICELVNDNNITDLLNNLSKNTLININLKINLSYSNKNKVDLINQIVNYYNNDNIDKISNNYNLGSEINFNKLIKVVDKIPFFIDAIQKGVNETFLRDTIIRELNKTIGNAHREYKLGGYFDLRIDIDILDGKFGIEIKKWESLETNNEFARAIGQAYIYSKQRYTNNNFVFIVFGLEEDKKHQKYLAFEKIIKELNGHVYFKVVSI